MSFRWRQTEVDHVSGVIISRRFYIVGGRGRDHRQSLDIKAPEKGWKVHVKMPTGRGGLALGVTGDYIATFGGEDNPTPRQTACSTRRRSTASRKTGGLSSRPCRIPGTARRRPQ
ncbi:uncharacterized protein F4812DRAFT_457611 [Daldinia caldariorum]|uniref:uncharacterized protein n=1 Tax=Daldinia caldariorum TaxID=326644 RepID=UPI002008868F|nr:uncharacterized protein F4812DRAFT_457611 [Daldinia caldariorum]KAI1469066.1 hypothetical protein F4812DRAFT_457611 [Daldinia caldariorum]